MMKIQKKVCINDNNGCYICQKIQYSTINIMWLCHLKEQYNT